MIERLSVDFVRKLFYLLTNGNAQIKFHTICMQNQNREMATNRPIEFGLKLLAYNIFYRIPLIRDIPIGRSIGKEYLTRQYLRLPVEDLASEILENPAVVCDLKHTLFLPVLTQNGLYEKLEKEFRIQGFARMRRKLQNSCSSIDEIYQRLNQGLEVNLSPTRELELAYENLIPNRYIIRLLDIAAYHDVKIYLTVDSPYPSSFFESLLQRHDIAFCSLLVSSETQNKKREMVRKLGLSHFGIVSADFNHFIRPLVKAGGKPIYYRAPVQLMKDARHPRISSDFKERYDAVCGARVFSGRKRPAFSYELGYLCAGPLVYSLFSLFEDAYTVCYASRHSEFAKLVGSRAVCTRSAVQKPLPGEVQVLDTGIDPQGFARYLQKLRHMYPDTCFRVISLKQVSGSSIAPLTGFFTNASSEMTDGIRDFCRDYSKYTQNDPISIQDGVRLYRCGCENMQAQLKLQSCAVQLRPAAQM